jgi:hypothetical protein
MASATTYLKTQLHNHMFRSGSFAKPANLYLALFTTKPASDGAGGVEVSAAPYARVDCGPLDAYWSEPDADGLASNLVEFTFARPTADWGTVVAWGVFDASTGGNLLLVEDLAETVTVTANSLSPVFPVGFLTIHWL